MSKQDRIKSLIKRRVNTVEKEHIVDGNHFIVDIVSVANSNVVDITATVYSTNDENSLRTNQEKIIQFIQEKYVKPQLQNVSAEVGIYADYEVENHEHEEKYRDVFSINSLFAGNVKVTPNDDLDVLSDQLDNLLNDEDYLNSKGNESKVSKDFLFPLDIKRLQIQISKTTRKYGRGYTEDMDTLFKKLGQFRLNNLYVPENQDDRCFDYCIALALEAEEHPGYIQNRLSLTRHQLCEYMARNDFSSCYNSLGFQFSKLKKACQILNRNIFVYTADEKLNVFRFFSDHNVYPGQPINLFYMPNFTNGNNHYEDGHFAYIKDLLLFLNNKERKNDGRQILCNYCVTDFYSKDKYDQHLHDCKMFHNSDLTRSILNSKLVTDKNPEPIEFTSTHMKTKQVFYGYYDFETSCLNDKKQHRGVSFGMLLFENGKVYKKILETAENQTELARKFFQHIADFRVYAQSKYQQYPVFTGKKPKEYDVCCLCEKEIEEDPVYHHSHYTGQGIGWAHETCNLQEQKSNCITMWAHNHNFDLKMLLPELFTPVKYQNMTYENNYSVISRSSQKFTSITMQIKRLGEDFFLPKVNFYDSLSFLASSLEKAAESLHADDLVHSTAFCKQMYGNNTLLQKAFTMKGLFPYETFDYKMLSQKDIPQKSDFDSVLSGPCSDKDYHQVQLVWNELAKLYGSNMTFKQYHDLYLYSDIYLLADVMETFKKVTYDSYGLELSYSPTLPSIGYQAMLLNKVRNNLKPCYTLTDKNLYLEFQKNIVGGYSACPVKKNRGGPETFLAYIDASNLYGVSMSEFSLPYKYYKTIQEDCQDYYDSITNTEKYTYFVKADIDHWNDDPEKFRQVCTKFHDFVPFPENIVVKPEYLSEYQRSLGTPTQSKKLIMHFFPKTVFTDYRLLKLAVDIGAVRIKNIHKIEVFHAQKHLRGFINQCRDLRNKATSDSAKNIFKLFSNSVYGKQLQNVLNFDESKFVQTTNDATILRHNNHPLFKSRTIINDKNVLYQRYPKEIRLNQAIFVGKSVLDLSKWVMLDFYYNKFMPVIKENKLRAQLLFTDTDSLAFEVFTQDSTVKNDVQLFKAIHEAHQCLDLSSWPKGHELHYKGHPTLDSKLHEKRPFTFGSEFKPDGQGQVIITPDQKQDLETFLEQAGIKYSISGFFEDTYTIKFNEQVKDMVNFHRLCPVKFAKESKQTVDEYRPDTYIGLRAKQYLFANSKSTSCSIKSKGIPKSVVKKFIKQQDFQDIVDLTKKEIRVKYYTLQSKNNIMTTIEQEKIALSSFDDKVYYSNPYSFEYFGSCLI